MLEAGIQPDVLVLRTEMELTQDVKEKWHFSVMLINSAVVQSVDVSSIYEVPIKMLEEGLDYNSFEQVKARVSKNEPPLDSVARFSPEKQANPKSEVTYWTCR